MKHSIALAALLLAATAGSSQTVPAPAQRPAASQGPITAPAGSYVLDPRHASVIIRIGHGGGVSLSTFRLASATGALEWNATAPEASKLNVTVDMTSLQSSAPDFAKELIGDKFLKTGQFHDSTFVSARIERTGPTTGRITGNLTFMGVTKPVAIEAKLVGAGKGMRGSSVIGFSGTAHFKRSEFGFTTMSGMIGDDVELLLDVEFNKPV